MKFLIIGLFVILSSAVSASNLPTKLYSINFPIAEFEATQKQKEEIYNNLYSAISLVANGPVLLPEAISIYTVKSYNNAYYFSPAQAIMTPYQLVFEGASKHPKFTRAVEVHEFAHSIFETNLPVLVRNDKKMLSLVNRFAKNKKTFEKEAIVMLGNMVAVELAHNTPYAEGAAVSYSNAEYAFNTALSKKETLVQNYLELAEQLSPFNEFFADVFAVVVLRDPEVIKNAIQYTAHSEIDSKNRSFNLRPGKRTYTFSPHDFYSFSRYHIYKYYLSNPEVRQMGVSWITNRALESIRCAFDSRLALMKDIEKNLETINGNETRYVVERMNNHLNNCIDTEFRK